MASQSLSASLTNSSDFMSIEDLIVHLQADREIHVIAAWLATSKNNNDVGKKFQNPKFLDHHWAILEVTRFDTDVSKYLAIHHFNSKQCAKLFKGFHEALNDNTDREVMNPCSYLRFETTGARPVMAHYLVPALQQLSRDYNLWHNNCHHHADFVLKTVQHAALFLDTCNKKTSNISWDRNTELLSQAHWQEMPLRESMSPESCYDLSTFSRYGEPGDFVLQTGLRRLYSRFGLFGRIEIDHAIKALVILPICKSCSARIGRSMFDSETIILNFGRG